MLEEPQKEKELTRARDALAAERRRMPWLAVDKAYQFEGPDGMASLLDLFDGRRQLIVYRAFYGPEVTTYAEGGTYPERACVVELPRRLQQGHVITRPREGSGEELPRSPAWEGSTCTATATSLLIYMTQ